MTDSGARTSQSSPPRHAPMWTLTVQAHDGAAIHIRPLRSDDREREIAFLNSLSEESRYLRLLTPQKFLPKHLIDQLMAIDGETSMAFVATVGDGEHERFAGVVRYGATDLTGVAEIGITVADNRRRQGVATQLMRILMRYAAAHGVETFTGMVLPHNTRMLELAKRLGFAMNRGNDGLVHIDLDLVD